MLEDDRLVPPDHAHVDRGRLTLTAAGNRDRATPLKPPYLLTTLTDRRGVAVAVTGDATTAVIEMAPHGGWTPHFGNQISACLRLCLAGPSLSVIIDLHHLDDPFGLSMPFWMAAWRRARLAAPPVSLVFCLPGTSTLGRRLRVAEGPRPRLFTGTAEARLAIAALVSQTDRLQARLTPRPSGVRAVRDLVTEACRDWELAHLLHDSSLIASELATNAAEHAGTDFVVTVSRRARRLHVAVQDGATGFPRLHRPASAVPAASLRGRGLLLVHTIAAAWGGHAHSRRQSRVGHADMTGRTRSAVSWTARPYGRVRDQWGSIRAARPGSAVTACATSVSLWL
ncbi:ATP-binding protein [Actinoplanes sp. NPDC049548]|uniref:ATP-binding protein n=1 Tax=Actinoplanes sp. NPDC049548 TaxID=3155152 RepID=UPI00341C90E6